MPEQDYLAVLQADLALEQVFAQGRKLQSIFIGGGTPSLMSGAFYQTLLAKTHELIPFADDIEITLEANPGTTEAERFVAYRDAGINRLSMGVQSFNDQHLQALGRIHDSAAAINAFGLARKAGFDNINLDLMHGLPEQSLEQALSDLSMAISLKPNHLSWYQLTIEPNTEFFNKPPTLPDDDRLWDIQHAGQALLAEQGFAQYEVSAFAQAGRQARHNLNYWQFGDYLAIGAGAHGKVSMLDEQRIMRYRKTRVPADYLKPKPFFRIGQEDIAQVDLPLEFLMNALRLNQGASEDLFRQRTGYEVSVLEPNLSELREQGLIDPTRIQATEKGHLFLNEVLSRFSQ